MVYAESLEVARQVGDAAEVHRTSLGKLWLGTAPAPSPNRCRIDVELAGRVGGMTEVSYAAGKVAFHKIKLHGPLERVLPGALPHEMTHLLFAHHFGVKTPRWADEGGAILANDGPASPGLPAGARSRSAVSPA